MRISELDFISFHLFEGNIDKATSAQLLADAAPLRLGCKKIHVVVPAVSLLLAS